MNREVTIEAEIGCDNSLLCRIADVLRTTPLFPEYFVWSAMTEATEVRIWMSMQMNDDVLNDLLQQLRNVSGVRSVTPLSPGAEILRSLAIHQPEPG
jgi:hypothetical protein